MTMSYKTIDDVTPFNRELPGANYYLIATICLFTCTPLALFFMYLGYKANSEYEKLSEAEKREYQKKR